MAIQIKRQGGGQTSSASPAAPSSLNYGELAVASNGDLYVGDGSRKAVGILTTNGGKVISARTTFSNGITFANNGAIFGFMASNDQWRIMGQGNTTDSGSLEIATGNNGNEPIYVRQYSQGGFPGSSVTRTLTLLDEDGNSYFPGIITTNSNTLQVNNTINSGYADIYVRGAKNQKVRFGIGNSTAGQSSQAFVEIGTMTNDGQILPISIRQYSDTSWHTIKYNLTLLDTYGNSAFPGRVIAQGHSDTNWIEASHEGRFCCNSFSTASAGKKANSYLSMKVSSGAWALCGLSGNTNLYFVYGTDSNYNNNNNSANKSIFFDANGYIHAERVYNAVYNDYAEYFPRNEETEPGDLISLDLNSKEEKYIKARKGFPIVGVHSNEYGHIIGGESKPDDLLNISEDEYNLKKYIPVGLCGRCKIKIKGKILKGQKVVISDTPGVGRAYNKATDSIEDYIDSVGIAVEDQQIDDDEIRLVRVKLG